MAILESVNVGLPKDVAWQGRTVHTGIWKAPVRRAADGPPAQRRRRRAGGPRRSRWRAARRASSTRLDSYRHWQAALRPRRLRATASSGRTSRSTGSPTTRCASATGIASARPSSRSPNPGSPASGSACGSGEPELPALLVAHHRPGFYLRVITEGQVAGRRRDRPDPRRPARARASPTSTPCCTCPSRDVPRLRAAVDVPALSPGWQQSFRELLERDADARRPRTRSPPPSRLAGFRPLRVDELVAESADGDVGVPGRRGRRPLPAARAGQFLTLRFPGAGRPAAGAQLLAVRRIPRPRPTGSASSASRTGSSAPT